MTKIGLHIFYRTYGGGWSWGSFAGTVWPDPNGPARRQLETCRREDSARACRQPRRARCRTSI